jgi:hypothetical protein
MGVLMGCYATELERDVICGGFRKSGMMDITGE